MFGMSMQSQETTSAGEFKHSMSIVSEHQSKRLVYLMINIKKKQTE